MTAGAFIHDLRSAMRSGGVSTATDEHLRNEFRRATWHAPNSTLADIVDKEIAQIEREAVTLRGLRAMHFGEIG